MDALAGMSRADQLIMGLARHHVSAHPEQMGVLYLAGHVRAYHGGSDLPRAHLARARIAMAATTDTWLADGRGDAVLVWSSPPGTALTGEPRFAAAAVRDLLGPDARPTICFDRGGWSPALFAELVAAGFRHPHLPQRPAAPRTPQVLRRARATSTFGHPTTYLLADRPIRVAYDQGRRYFACRR